MVLGVSFLWGLGESVTYFPSSAVSNKFLTLVLLMILIQHCDSTAPIHSDKCTGWDLFTHRNKSFTSPGYVML